MKKFTLTLTVMFLMLSISTVFCAIKPITAHTEDAPQWTVLLASSPHPYTDKWNEFVVGYIRIWNDATNIYITLMVADGTDWVIVETHLAVAESLDDIPQTKKGNPKIGKFPYKNSNTNSYTIPIGSWTPGIELIIAAHAVVENSEGFEETAWGDCGGIDAQFPGGSWATYFYYVVQLP